MASQPPKLTLIVHSRFWGTEGSIGTQTPVPSDLMDAPHGTHSQESHIHHGHSHQPPLKHTHSHGNESCNMENDEFYENDGILVDLVDDEPYEDDEKEEIAHYEAVVGAFAFYNEASRLQLKRMLRQFSLIPPRHQKLLEAASQDPNGCISPLERFRRLQVAADINTSFINLFLSSPDQFLENVNLTAPADIIRRPTQPRNPSMNPLSGFNAEKVQSTLCQLVREWSSEGLPERISTFSPIMEALDRYLPVHQNNRYHQKVICPGSGLGRLPLEICMKGYMSLANEFSYFMLVVSSFMLNKTKKEEEFTIYPWIHQVSNVRSVDEQLKGVKIPDIWPGSLPKDAQFGCAAGDFLEIARDQESEWDAVVTCFFLDTANNIIDYMEAIWSILKPGGYWINIGPLLYHYTGSNEPSLELTLDQVLWTASKIGFSLLEQRSVQCHYTRKGVSMMNVVYDTEFWVAQKPVKPHD